MPETKCEVVGDVAGEFISAEIASEEARKSSLESRGLGVISTSGGLVTLLMGLAVVVTHAVGFALTDSERWLLTGAAGLYVVASGLGIATNWPVPSLRIDPESLVTLLDPTAWNEEASDAKRELAVVRRAQLADAVAWNERKARIVLAAMSFEVAAVSMTVLATTAVLINN